MLRALRPDKVPESYTRDVPRQHSAFPAPAAKAPSSDDPGSQPARTGVLAGAGVWGEAGGPPHRQHQEGDITDRTRKRPVAG